MVEVVVKYCWIACTKQSVITLAALITPSSRPERKKYDVERYQASNRTARYGNSADALPSDYRRRSFGCGRTSLLPAVFLVVEGVFGIDSMGYGSGVHGSGVHVRCGLRVAVVRRIVHAQDA